MRALIWRCVRIVHHADYAWFLPFLARLPLRLAYALSALRGWINAGRVRSAMDGGPQI
jgi:hypothetical protein